jgi:M6 family metalloprotease-like protein
MKSTRRTIKAITSAVALMLIAVGMLAASPAQAETMSEINARFFGTMTVNGARATGERPLAVTLVDFSDAPMTQNRAFYDYLVFGEGSPSDGLRYTSAAGTGNVREHFRQSSYGAFTWRKAGLFGPYRHPDDPRTTANESTKACVLDPVNCPGIGLVSLRTSNGSNFLQATNGGGAGSTIVATPRAASTWENFTLVDRNGGSLNNGDPINLIAFSNNFVTAENGGGGPLVANRTAAAQWEGFRIVKKSGSAGSGIVSGDNIALQVYNGSYVSAINGGGGEVVANRPNAGAWETFQLTEAPHDSWRELRIGAQMAVANGGLDVAPFDADGDRTVEANELGFVHIISKRTGWGQYQGDPDLGTFGGVKVRPASAGFDAFPGLDSLVHELTHALGAEHVYGSTNNSANLTPMSGTVGDGAEDASDIEYDRAMYHLDPWTKYRLGWLRPTLVAINTTSGMCYSIAATDDTTAGFTQGSSSGTRRPILFYNPSRVGEYYLAEFRMQAGYDTNIPAAGVALWLVKTDADGSLAEMPGNVINPGADGTLDSVAAANTDDFQGMGAWGPRIFPGANRLIESPLVNDDGYSPDPVNVAIGASGLQWGGSTPWTTAHGLIRPWWSDRTTTTGLRMRVDTTTFAGRANVEAGRNGPFRPFLQTLSSTTVSRGALVTINGAPLGVGSNKTVRLSGATGSFNAQIVSYDCLRAVVRVPSTMTPGSYSLSIVASGPEPVTSNTLSITVM